MDSTGILNPPNPVFITRSVSPMLEEDKQHCEDADEAGFCDLMFPMKRGMHLLEQEAQTNHQQQNYRLRLQQASLTSLLPWRQSPVCPLHFQVVY